MDLTVWCVFTGDKYVDDDVRILRDMVSRQLALPHRFLCLADRQIEGVDTLISHLEWPGWWLKLALFWVSRGQNLYLDLDSVVVGPLEPLLSDQLSMPANWAQSGHGGCQSSVMSWSGDYTAIPGSFDPDQLNPPERGNCGGYGARNLWGDQEFITELLGDPGAGRVKPMDRVISYKYHCRNGLPSGASVVSFHGDPKPSKVSDPWVLGARRLSKLSTATAA